MTDEEVARLADVREVGAAAADRNARRPPDIDADPLGRIAWATASVGENHPATIDAVRAAQPRYTWREIGVALGEDLADPSMPGRVQRRFAKRFAKIDGL